MIWSSISELGFSKVNDRKSIRNHIMSGVHIGTINIEYLHVLSFEQSLSHHAEQFIYNFQYKIEDQSDIVISNICIFT